jgi:hypothetical protein
MDASKVQAVVDWQTPSSLRDVQCFLGFANFYHIFIKDYSKIVMTLIELAQKNKSFTWSASVASIFENLKKAFNYFVAC